MKNISALAVFLMLLAVPSLGWCLTQGWFEDGLDHLEAQRYDDAIKAFSKSVEINPRYAPAYNNRGIAWRMKGDMARAMEDYDKALEIDPDFVDAYSNRSILWFFQGQWAKALADCSKALALDPGRIWAKNQMAWILATCPDERFRNGEKAVALAQQIVEISDNPVFYDTLAAAYAETGNFTQAVALQERVMRDLGNMLGAGEDNPQTYQQHLRAYQSGRPWRLGSQEEQESLLPRMQYSVQAGAFLSGENARNHASALRARGYQPRIHVLSSSNSGKIWHLVLLGAYPSSEEAKTAASEIKAKEGISTAVFSGAAE